MNWTCSYCVYAAGSPVACLDRLRIVSSQPEAFLPVSTFWNESSQIFGYLGVVSNLNPPKSTLAPSQRLAHATL